MTVDIGFADAAVKAAFDAFPLSHRGQLMRLRELIFQAAAENRQISSITETLKWGQPSYLPSRPKIGSTVRLGMTKGSHPRSAFYFHCQTSLAETYRLHYGDLLSFEGTRAILFDPDEGLPGDAIRHCASLALTYHLWRASGG